jgi:hypothetical protein
MFRGLNTKLGLREVGVTALQDSVPLPVFLSDPRNPYTKLEEDLFIKYYFLAQVTLRTHL